MIQPTRNLTLRGHHDLFSLIMIYSFDHKDEREDDRAPLIDTTDIDELSDIPHQPDDDDDPVPSVLRTPAPAEPDDQDLPAPQVPPAPPGPPQEPVVIDPSTDHSWLYPDPPPGPPGLDGPSTLKPDDMDLSKSDAPMTEPVAPPPDPPEDPGAPAPRLRRGTPSNSTPNIRPPPAPPDTWMPQTASSSRPPGPPPPPGGRAATGPSRGSTANPMALPKAPPSPTPTPRTPGEAPDGDQLDEPATWEPPPQTEEPSHDNLDDTKEYDDFDRSRTRDYGHLLPSPSPASPQAEQGPASQPRERDDPAATEESDANRANTEGEHSDTPGASSSSSNEHVPILPTNEPHLPTIPEDEFDKEEQEEDEEVSKLLYSFDESQRLLYQQCSAILRNTSQCTPFISDLKKHENDEQRMFQQLSTELEYMEILTGKETPKEFFMDILSGDIFKLDDENELTDNDFRYHASEINAADRKELAQFVEQ